MRGQTGGWMHGQMNACVCHAMRLHLPSPHLTQHLTSHLTPHTSRLTPHTSHLSPLASRVTSHVSPPLTSLHSTAVAQEASGSRGLAELERRRAALNAPKAATRLRTTCDVM